MGDERHPARPGVVHPTEAAGRDRTKSVGANRNPGAKYLVPAPRIPDNCSAHGSLLDLKVFHRAAGTELNARANRSPKKSLVEYPAGHREADCTGTLRRCQREAAGQPTSPGGDDRSAGERACAQVTQLVQDIEPLEQVGGARSQVFGAGFIAGEVTAIQQNDAMSGRGEPEGCGASGRSGANDQDI
jgi:hypothetical protein